MHPKEKPPHERKPSGFSRYRTFRRATERPVRRFGTKAGRLIPSLADGYDLDDLTNYIKPERDYLFNYLGIKTLYDRYLIKLSEIST